jgi:hypothetical protein
MSDLSQTQKFYPRPHSYSGPKKPMKKAKEHTNGNNSKNDSKNEVALYNYRKIQMPDAMPGKYPTTAKENKSYDRSNSLYDDWRRYHSGGTRKQKSRRRKNRSTVGRRAH